MKHALTMFAALAVAAPVALAQERDAQQSGQSQQRTTQDRADQARQRNAQDSADQQRSAQDRAGQAKGAQDRQTAGQGGINDELFVVVAATSGIAEVQLSELGLQKATDPELKRFSQQMIDDHQKANQELMALARDKGISPPRQLPPNCQFTLQSLAGLSGEEFDKCYAKAQTIAHMEAVSAFEAAAQRGRDAEVKAWATKTLPHLQEHLAMIKPLYMKYNPQETADNAHGRRGGAQDAGQGQPRGDAQNRQGGAATNP